MKTQPPTPDLTGAPAKRSFVSPALQPLGLIHEVTRGPNAAANQDAIIFQPGGDPAVGPS